MSKPTLTSTRRTRKLTRALALAGAVIIATALAGLSHSSAIAAGPQDAVSIALYPDEASGFRVGQWRATGAIEAWGTYVRTGGHANPSIPGCVWLDACYLEHTGAFQEEFVLTSSRAVEDTITIMAEEQLTRRDTIPPPSTGVWQIKAGTGSYDRLSGHGTSEFIVGDPLTLSLTGVISKAD